MANRRRLDPALEHELRQFIAETLAETGEITDRQRKAICAHAGRSDKTVQRWINDAVATLDLAVVTSRAVEPLHEGSSVDAFLLGQPWHFDNDMQRAALAYGGNLAQMHADADKLAKRLGVPGPISYSQLTRKFNVELDSDQRGFIRKGIAGFKNGALYTRWSADYRNECWQIDATKLDMWVLPKGSDTEVRPDILVIVDDHSRVILSAVLMLHAYTAEDAAAAVHRAMRMRTVTLDDGTIIEVGGKPEKILCDNALQFTGELLTALATIIGFAMWATAVYAGEAKGKVERTIRAVNEDFAKKLPGYANPALQTLTLKDFLKGLHQDLLDEEEVTEELGKWVEQWNHSPHPDHPGKSRYQVWADSHGPVEEVDPELLMPATVLVRDKPYKFSKVGFRITRSGEPYRYTCPDMTGKVGDKFYLRHLPGETDWVDAYDVHGDFVARCWDERLAEADKNETASRRRARYRQLSTLRSEAVELRAVATAEVADSDERPNQLAAAHARATTPPSPELIRASLGLPAEDTGMPDLPGLSAGDPDEGSETSIAQDDIDYDAIVADVLDIVEGDQ